MIWSAILSTSDYSLKQDIIQKISDDYSKKKLGDACGEVIRQIKDRHLGGKTFLGKNPALLKPKSVDKEKYYGFQDGAVLKLRDPYPDDFFSSSFSRLSSISMS